MDDLLTSRDVMKKLNIGEDKLRELRRTGELHCINTGSAGKRGTYRYDPADIEAWKLKKKGEQCPSSSAPIRRTGSIPTISGSAVADFQEARARLLARKRSR